MDSRKRTEQVSRAAMRLERNVRRSLLHAFALERSSWDWLKLWGPAFLVTLVGLIIAWQFVRPLPPSRIVLASGQPGGAYHETALAYKQILARQDVELVIVETEGSIENLRRLRAGEAEVAFVQGGTARPDDANHLVGLASVYFEPLWVFYVEEAVADRLPDEASPPADNLAPVDDQPPADEHAPPTAPALDDLSQLAGLRIAIGPDGSGTRATALQLLRAVGVTGDDATFLPYAGSEAAEALRNRETDVVMMVVSPDAPVIHDLSMIPGVRLLDMSRSVSYRRHFPYLTCTIISEGLVDLARNLPAQPSRVIAPAATLAARSDLHPDLIPLLLEAASRVHSDGDMLGEPGEFPSALHVELPLSEQARRYLERGPSFLQRYLPFFAAALLDRIIIMAVPLITLVIPILRITPPLVRWQIRRRVYLWYRVLHQIEQRNVLLQPIDERRHDIRMLDRMEKEVASAVNVPLSYMDEFYHLRLHAEFVRRNIENTLTPGSVAAARFKRMKRHGHARHYLPTPLGTSLRSSGKR